MNKHTPLLPNWLLLGTALFCFIAIANLPIGYYRLLRFITCGSAIAAAVKFHKKRRADWVWALGIIAIIFNPIIPIHFSRNTWRVIDLLAGITFLITFGICRKEDRQECMNKEQNIRGEESCSLSDQPM